MTSDFRFAYVAAHSNRAMPVLYKFAAWWGGQEGSLLFWSWLLSTYSAVVVFTNRRKYRDMMPWVIGVLMAIQSFFLHPEQLRRPARSRCWRSARAITAVPDGKGLNPLLQYWTMVIHPPMLYLGYVGFVGAVRVRHGLADHAAAGRRLDPHDAALDAGHLAVPEHRHHARRGLGVRGARLGRLLGLGPGGERFAAAVAHRHRLPALRHDAGEEGHDEGLEHGAGFGHLLPVHLRHVPDALAASSVRCTPSRSRRSASTSSRFLALGIAATVYLILDRLDYLKSEAQLESVLSRESSFLFNNLILLASCFAVLWGTLFPVISEAVTGEKISRRRAVLQPRE